MVRSMAYQCADDQKSTDLFVLAHPSHAHGCPSSTSPVYGLIKNRIKVAYVVLNSHVGGTPINKLPILLLIHEVGLEEPNI